MEGVEISLEELLNLKEENLIMLLPPGRMGGNDTILVYKNDDKFYEYYIDGVKYWHEIYETFPKANEERENYLNDCKYYYYFGEHYYILDMGMGCRIYIKKEYGEDFISNVKLLQEKKYEQKYTRKQILNSGPYICMFWREAANLIVNAIKTTNSLPKSKIKKMIHSVIGHAIGDAMGMPTEFGIREKLQKEPVTEMIGSEKTGQPAGSWTDDTSMLIATIDSYLEKGYFNYSDIMNKWEIWIKGEDYTAAGEVFDVGRTCLRAISNYKRGMNPVEAGIKDLKANGNGSLMRILPVALYSYAKKMKEEEIIKLTNDISSLTHGHDIAKLGCYIYVKYIMLLLDGYDKNKAYSKLKEIDYSSYSEEAISKYDRILKDDIGKYDLDDISSTGYVVDTLESALWLLLTTNDFNEAIIGSTNIGNDTDSIGAILGAMAGIVYGIDTVNSDWRIQLQRSDYLFELSKKFANKLFE